MPVVSTFNSQKIHTNVAMMPRKKLISNWQQDQDEGCSLDSSIAERPLSHTVAARKRATMQVLENSLYKKGVPPSHHLMGNATVETLISTWPPLMCVSVLIVCLENKHGQSYLLLKVIVTTTFQWLFAERFFHHQDGLKPRTLFVIPHKFFWGIMLSSFFKRVTPTCRKPCKEGRDPADKIDPIVAPRPPLSRGHWGLVLGSHLHSPWLPRLAQRDLGETNT